MLSELDVATDGTSYDSYSKGRLRAPNTIRKLHTIGTARATFTNAVRRWRALAKAKAPGDGTGWKSEMTGSFLKIKSGRREWCFSSAAEVSFFTAA